MTDLLNPVIVVSFVVWIVAQGSKYALSKAVGRDVRFSATGGMPSAHSAVVASAVMIIGLREGPTSSLFGLAVIIAAIVVHDAIRLRWAVGQQALRINQLVLKSGGPSEDYVAVWMGHRIREVSVGLALGAGLSLLLYNAAYG